MSEPDWHGVRPQTRKRLRALSVATELGGRLANDFAKNAVEMSERLKTDVVRDFAHPTISVLQQSLGFFNTHSSNVVSKGQSGGAPKKFAKIKCAGVHRFGDRGKTKRAVLVSGDELLGARDSSGFGIGIFERNLIAQDG